MHQNTVLKFLRQDELGKMDTKGYKKNTNHKSKKSPIDSPNEL
jgi:hypothetical protein